MNNLTITGPTLFAKQTNLYYINDLLPGITRVKKGKGFTYLEEQGKPVTDLKTINRIETLVIPPAWQNVWIAPSEFAHIQATGIDEKGRKQYLYHPDFIKIQQQHKFEKLLFFAGSLPEIRKKIEMDMQIKGLQKDKILATIVWILENTYIRIGNPEYAKENKHYGLTTMLTKHVDVEGTTVQLNFVGKSGKEHQVDINHPKVAKTIRKLEELPGYELFQYVDENSQRHHVTSEQVNEYLKSITGEKVTAKDFRTWGGTVLAGKKLYDLGPAESKTAKKKNITQAVKTVSKHLRNTPATARSYYIHPAIPSTYEKEILIPHFEEIYQKVKQEKGLTKDEVAVFELLKKNPLDNNF